MAQRPDGRTGTSGGPHTSGASDDGPAAGARPGAPVRGGARAPADPPPGSHAAVPGPGSPTPPAPEPQDARAAGPHPAGVDLLGMDLETLRTTSHPVLAALVGELRARVAAPGSEALWGFDNAPPPTPDRR